MRQGWPLLTALFVRDGGIAGGVFNLVSLLFVGTLAEQLWRRTSWLTLFFGGALLTELAALSWQPIGAGNSVANFNLAAGLAVGCLWRHACGPARLAAWVSLGAGAVLVSRHDIHGLAVAFGAALALGLLRHGSAAWV